MLNISKKHSNPLLEFTLKSWFLQSREAERDFMSHSCDVLPSSTWSSDSLMHQRELFTLLTFNSCLQWVPQQAESEQNLAPWFHKWSLQPLSLPWWNCTLVNLNHTYNQPPPATSQISPSQTSQVAGITDDIVTQWAEKRWDISRTLNLPQHTHPMQWQIVALFS